MNKNATKDRPILFSAPMVNAILSGSKTQTRRVVKPQPTDWESNDATAECPYGTMGDRLWVRETAIISPKNWDVDHNCTHTDSDGDGRIVQYLATSPDRDTANGYNLKATPSIFMPRWASRIMLEITDVRAERLNEISEDDAKAEGIESHDKGVTCPVAAFRILWDSISGKTCPWQSNPWVWIIEFKRGRGTNAA